MTKASPVFKLQDTSEDVVYFLKNKPTNLKPVEGEVVFSH